MLIELGIAPRAVEKKMSARLYVFYHLVKHALLFHADQHLARKGRAELDGNGFLIFLIFYKAIFKPLVKKHQKRIMNSDFGECFFDYSILVGI